VASLNSASCLAPHIARVRLLPGFRLRARDGSYIVDIPHDAFGRSKNRNERSL
jgi:hypothetical protein